MKFNRISLLLLILCLGILIGCGGSGGSGGNSGGSNSNVTPPISSTPSPESQPSSPTPSPGSPPSSPTPSPEPPSATLGIKILVPAYFYPTTNNQYWNQLATEAQKKADFIYAIVNVNNGPGNSKNSDYASAISNLHNKGGRILGYVYTSDGNRSQSDVQADIDRWFQWYGTNYIDGIFLDEQANSSGKEGYYKSIYQYIQSKKSAALVVGNPGTNTIESYLVSSGQRVTDVVCVFETDSAQFSSWTPAAWYSKYSRENFYVLLYNCSTGSWTTRIDQVKNKNVGWVYITNDILDNPWDTLPPYFGDLCNYVRGL